MGSAVQRFHLNYYNENNPVAAEWLLRLMGEGLIPLGDIDKRSIKHVEPTDLRGYTQCHFFAGIGGWPLALHLAGWPESRRVWTGSPPCQPFSCAGKYRAASDERHLWPRFCRIICEGQSLYGVPTIFGEQVSSALGREWLVGVRASLEAVGYVVGAGDICSAGAGAPNIRQRLYWVAHASIERSRSMADGPYWQEISDTGRGSACSGLADATQRCFEGPRRAQPQWCEPADGSANGWVGDTQREGLSAIRQEPAWPGAAGEQTGRLGLAEGTGLPVGISNGGSSGAVVPASTGEGSGEGSHALNFWSESRWHWCRDGKYRRIPVEPAFFPLAARVSGRVASLRGYGNAINPQVAAEFVKAYMDL